MEKFLLRGGEQFTFNDEANTRLDLISKSDLSTSTYLLQRADEESDSVRDSEQISRESNNVR